MNELAVVQRPSRENSLSNRVQEWLLSNYKGKARRTRLIAQHCMEEFEIFVGHRPIDRLLMLQWDEYQEKKGLKASTINKKGQLIRAFMRWCEDAGYMTAPPIRAVVRHQPKAMPLPSIFTEREYERIKAATIGTNNYFLTVVGRATGMSLIDICYLRWASVDMENLYIHTNRIKTMWRGPESSQFWVPIMANSDLHLLLQELHAARTNKYNNESDEFVNPDLRGLYGYRQARASEIYVDMLKKLGIKGKSFKNWRNTFMSHVANSGANMGLAVRLTAHKDPSVYAAYIKPDIEALRNIVQSAFQWASDKETVKQLREHKK